ncbi:MAG: hypothetical protein NZ992_00985 [Candidatus Korarchaeum sp.]|nr:hypothetical protein [Candidatus Korarchaeum sp.]MDW8035796.1 hypothetical protein [Candidatus Korarchaeum sp.]
MRVKLLAALLISALALALVFALRVPPREEEPKGSWRITIAYPTSESLPGGVALSSYSITICLSFFSEGKVNETNLAVGSLSEVERGNVTIVIRLADETSVMVFKENSTVVVQGKDQEGLFAATDRLVLAVAGDYALDLDSSRNYLRVVHPSRGHQVGLPWLGGYTLQQVRRVPIYSQGGQVDLRRFLLGPLSP